MNKEIEVGDIIKVVALTKEEQDKLDFPDLINAIQYEEYLGVVFTINENYATIIFDYMEVEKIPVSMLRLYLKSEGPNSFDHL
jgi:hypothetical protein